MKVISKDLKHGEIKLIPENLDDIWYLYNIIEKDDLVRAFTFRSSEEKDDKKRSKKAEKKRMLLGIRVTDVKFHEFADRLRVHGVIEEGGQDLGSFHTINIKADEMESVTIVKEKWKDHQLARIEEAVRLRDQPVVLLISIDEECATVANLHQSGIQWIADIYSKRSGKMYESKYDQSNYFDEVISVVKSNKTDDSTIVILGPGFVKDSFIKYGKEKYAEIFGKAITYATGHAGMNGVQEAIKTGLIKHMIKENRVILETEYIEKLLEEIKKDGLATYGLEEVKKAFDSGAVERLLIIDKIVRTKEGENLLRLAKEKSSKFTIINTSHEAGKKIEGLGGIAAILRFKV